MYRFRVMFTNSSRVKSVLDLYHLDYEYSVRGVYVIYKVKCSVTVQKAIWFSLKEWGIEYEDVQD